MFIVAAIQGLMGKIANRRIPTGWTTHYFVPRYGPKQYTDKQYDKEVCDDLHRRGYY
jgi:hypothetical protein